MREYRQLTEDDRIEIYAMKQAGKKQNKIPANLGVAPSTISRGIAYLAVKSTVPLYFPPEYSPFSTLKT
jgi:IS30 family transposase